MLISCSFKNLFSFEKLVSFSMVAGKSKTYSERVAKFGDEIELLKFSAIYGANASGKSNFIKSIREFRKLLLLGAYKHKRQYNFAGNSDPSYFEVNLNIDGKNYNYGFEYSYKANRFVSEWLYRLKITGEERIFERNIETGSFDLDIDIPPEDAERINVYKGDLANDGDKLFTKFIFELSSPLSAIGFQEIKSIFKWFVLKFEVVFPDSSLATPYYFINKKKLANLSDFMKRYGTGIESLDSVPLRNDEINELLPSKLIESVSSEILEKKNMVGMLRSSRGNMSPTILVRYESKKKEVEFRKIVFNHMIGGEKVVFDSSQESDGTLRLLELSAIVLTGADEMTVFVDEFDRCLHPLLVVQFIKDYLKKTKLSKCRWQLIITTHESLLMDLNILRRDEIWFVEKNNSASELYSLDEFQVRNDCRPNKSYIEGRYGAVPIFQEALGAISDED